MVTKCCWRTALLCYLSHFLIFLNTPFIFLFILYPAAYSTIEISKFAKSSFEELICYNDLLYSMMYFVSLNGPVLVIYWNNLIISCHLKRVFELYAFLISNKLNFHVNLWLVTLSYCCSSMQMPRNLKLMEYISYIIWSCLSLNAMIITVLLKMKTFMTSTLHSLWLKYCKGFVVP